MKLRILNENTDCQLSNNNMLPIIPFRDSCDNIAREISYLERKINNELPICYKTFLTLYNGGVIPSTIGWIYKYSNGDTCFIDKLYGFNINNNNDLMRANFDDNGKLYQHLQYPNGNTYINIGEDSKENNIYIDINSKNVYYANKDQTLDDDYYKPIYMGEHFKDFLERCTFEDQEAIKKAFPNMEDLEYISLRW